MPKISIRVVCVNGKFPCLLGFHLNKSLFQTVRGLLLFLLFEEENIRRSQGYTHDIPINFNNSSESILPAISSLRCTVEALWRSRHYTHLLGISQTFGILAYAFTLSWRTFVGTAVFRVIVLPTASFRKSVTSLAASLTFLPEREKGRD